MDRRRSVYEVASGVAVFRATGLGAGGGGGEFATMVVLISTCDSMDGWGQDWLAR
jgi:hypothetical protein